MKALISALNSTILYLYIIYIFTHGCVYHMCIYTHIYIYTYAYMCPASHIANLFMIKVSTADKLQCFHWLVHPSRSPTSGQPHLFVPSGKCEQHEWVWRHFYAAMLYEYVLFFITWFSIIVSEHAWIQEMCEMGYILEGQSNKEWIIQSRTVHV